MQYRLAKDNVFHFKFTFIAPYSYVEVVSTSSKLMQLRKITVTLVNALTLVSMLFPSNVKWNIHLLMSTESARNNGIFYCESDLDLL